MPPLAYSFIYCLFLPFICFRLVWRSIRQPRYRQRFWQRFGFYHNEPMGDSIWLHAVSVGEVIAAVPLVEYIQSRLPEKNIVITTMTPTGAERVETLFGDSVTHVYVPFDLSCVVQRFIKQFSPQLLILLETELWPNLLTVSKSHNVSIILANARLSEKSARGYARFSSLTKKMLDSLDVIAAQYEEDAKRWLSLGATEQKLSVTGSIKFDIAVSEKDRAAVAQLRTDWRQVASRFVWVAASTHPGEEEIVLEAYRYTQAEYTDLLLVLVPRHPERADEIIAMSCALGLNTAKFSECNVPTNTTQVVVVDTIGDLFKLYGMADIAFVGGSLVERGGHNMLEPAAWGVPIITGNSDFNFSVISKMLEQAGGLAKVSNGYTLEQRVLHLITDATSRERQGQLAAQVVEQNRGSLQKLIKQVDSYL